jgi:hypothetical protein
VSEGVAEITPEVILEMKAKHPEAEGLPKKPEEPLPAAVLIDGDVVIKQLKSFPKGTAPGADGLRVEHLKNMLVNVPAGVFQDLSAAYTGVINTFISGRVPAVLSVVLCSAPITPLKKAKGGIRPIAVGETWRRLVSKCAMAAVGTAVGRDLSPLQVGVGVKDGAVSAVHAIQAVIRRFGE